MVSDITVQFNFTKDGGKIDFTRDIDPACDNLDGIIEDLVDEVADDNECGEDEGWDFADFKVIDWDDDYTDPSDFSDLKEYGRFAEKVDQHGEAYALRYDDIGEHDFDEQYNGEWDDEGSFAESIVEDCYGIDVPSWVVIDWDATANNLMMDYSSYDGGKGVYIFRDC